MPKYGKLALVGLFWLAVYFRIPALFANHFHADEALFSSWARLVAVWRDPLLAAQFVDKPPLLFYLQALFFPLMGAVEWASRLPNLIVSLLLIPLVAILSWRIYRETVPSLLAALFIALSPLAIQFSATAFTDPLLTFLLILSLFFLAGDKPQPVLSGLFFGLAVTAKYQAWIFLPLLLGFSWLQNWKFYQWRRWLAGFLPILLILAVWEIARSGTPVIWSNQIGNFGGLRLIYSWEILPRFLSWFRLWQISFSSPLILGLLIVSIATLIVNSTRSRSKKSGFDLLLLVFCFGYAILHWLLAVPVWDRYLLPLIPLAVILLARGLVCLWRLIADRFPIYSPQLKRSIWRITAASLIFAILSLILIPSAALARAGRLPIGGQPTADQGAWQVAAYLGDEPYGTVLYDHWNSWHWQYHLFDKGVFVSWFPHPAALAADLTVFGDTVGARYIVLPDDDTALPVRRAVHDAGFKLNEELRTDNQPGIILYRLQR